MQPHRLHRLKAGPGCFGGAYNYRGLMAPQLSLCHVWYHLIRFFMSLVVFSAAFLHTVRLVKRMQYQFTRSW